MNLLNLDNDGIYIKQSFIPIDIVNKIDKELSFLFNISSIDGSLGYMDLSNNLRLKSSRKKIVFPDFAIRSVNLPELSLLVLDQITEQLKKNKEDFFLTNISIFSEINPTPMFWHTDNRKGMIRAFLYIRGGNANSGAFKYMKGTHKRDYYIEHKLSFQEVERLKDKIFICEGSPGDLVLSDTLGFHGNCPRLKERRVIVFEFQPKNLNENEIESQSNIFLSSKNLTDEVIKNIDIFRNKSYFSKNLHGSDEIFFNYQRVKSSSKIYYFFKHSVKFIKSIFVFFYVDLLKKLFKKNI